MAKIKKSEKAEKQNFGKRKTGRHSKAKNKQPKKYGGQGRQRKTICLFALKNFGSHLKISQPKNFGGGLKNLGLDFD